MAFLLFTPLLAIPATAAAQGQSVDVLDRGLCDRDKAKDSPVCQDKKIYNEGNDKNPLTGSGGVLMTVINILTTIVSIAAIIIIILAGLKFITSGNNPQDAANARERVIYALIALVIAAMAQVIVRFIIARTIDSY